MKKLLTLLLSINLAAYAAGLCAAPRLSLPKDLIAFGESSGVKLLNSSVNKDDFFRLVRYFVTENGLAYCGVASAVMVLNALDIPPPNAPSHAPYKIFNQTNFFNNEVLKVITPPKVYARGATLEQIAKSIAAFNVKVNYFHAADRTLHQFKRDAILAIGSDKQYIIVNFCRKYINEEGCGHFSPLAAYHKASDRFLLLDVARYKYPPVWVKADSLYKAMREGMDSESQKTRGYILVSKPK